MAVLALDGVVAFDLSSPLEVFRRTRLPDGRAPYQVRVCAPSPEVDAGAFTIRTPFDLDTLANADTIILPSYTDPIAQVPAEVLHALRRAAANGARIASVCTGAFILAATGLLDGRRATTHWKTTDLLATRYARVHVDPHALYVDEGQFLTAAGASAGLDMCLHLIRRDHGSAVAADIARRFVTPLKREGGQAQSIDHDHPPMPRGSVLEPLLRWMQDNAGRDLTLDRIAAHAGMSARTLNRRFLEQTGTTPMHWLNLARIRQAQHLLESTADPVERIAAQVGFGSPTAFRDRFKRVVGTNPHAYRHSFKEGAR